MNQKVIRALDSHFMGEGGGGTDKYYTEEINEKNVLPVQKRARLKKNGKKTENNLITHI